MTQLGSERLGGLWNKGGKRVAGREVERPMRERVPKVPAPPWKSLAAIAAIAATVVGIGLGYQQPWFRVANVAVDGNTAVSSDAVLQATGLLGKHILEINDVAVGDALVGLTRVKRVAVERQFPNSIVLHVEERAPWAIWQADQQRFLIDSDGIVLDNAPAKITLPVLIYRGTTTVKPGGRVDPDLVRQALAVDRRLPEAGKAKATRYEYTEPGGLLMISDQGWQARFGNADDLDYKIATLKAIVDKANADRTQFTAVDLRFGERPFIR